MPRRKSAVKVKHVPTRRSRVAGPITPGLVDLHFHGAFGIDTMTADEAALTRLAERLWEAGVAAFCPTTLSVSESELKQSVSRIGKWTRKGRHAGALPLGIHLEGPFLNPAACGAHPPGAIRRLSLSELDALWEASSRTLKLLTFAPELLSEPELKALVSWSRSRKITLSLGHSRATEEQAARAFALGVRGVTHAWNALPFHHRAPGPLGAALGRKDTHIELILDQVHVHPRVIQWTRRLHGTGPICFVSDCVPAAGTGGEACAFGPLEIRQQDGASRLPDGSLAGGGLLLPEALGRWAAWESAQTGASARNALHCLKDAIPSVTSTPLKALGLSPALLRQRKVRWTLGPEQVYLPVPIRI